jgi:hypothetical protein
MTALLVALALSLGDEAEANQALEKFKTDYKDKDAKVRAAAVEELAKTEHDKVAAKLGQILMADVKEVRIAAAKGLGTHVNERKKPAAYLANALAPNAKEPEVLVAIFMALGTLKEDLAAPEVNKFFDDDVTDVAKSSIQSAGAIRNATSIDPLIKLLKELEQKSGRAGGAPGKGGGGFGGLGKGLGGGGASKEERERARALIPAVRDALKSITKADYDSAEGWSSWWKINKPTFRVEK